MMMLRYALVAIGAALLTVSVTGAVQFVVHHEAYNDNMGIIRQGYEWERPAAIAEIAKCESQILTRKSFPALSEALRDDDVLIRGSAALALAKQGNEDD